MNPMRALRQYQKVNTHAQISEASPHRLVQLLMEGALDRMAQAKGAMARGDIAQKGLMLGKAVDILVGLRDGLNPEKTPDPIALQQLDNLYAFMTMRLLEANRQNDAAMIDEVAGLMITLKEGWDALQKIDETREALSEALAERNWGAIGELDLGCRALIDAALNEESADEAAIRAKLEDLLSVYQQLLEATTGERQAIFEEMSQFNRAKHASKVYHMFG
eukprot:gene22335-34213_t